MKISPYSSKRVKEMKAYKRVCDEMDGGQLAQCWFCGELIDVKRERPDHHHTVGRDGDLLLSREYLVHCHRGCHSEYHHSSLSQLLKTKWYVGWLNSLSVIEKFRSVYRKELDKFSKNNLNPNDYGIRSDI